MTFKSTTELPDTGSFNKTEASSAGFLSTSGKGLMSSDNNGDTHKHSWPLESWMATTYLSQPVEKSQETPSK